MKAYKVGRVGGENVKLLHMFLSLGEWKGNVMALRKGKKKKIKRSQLLSKCHENTKPMACSKSSSMMEVYSNTILPQEKHQIDNLILYLKQLEKEEQNTPKISRRRAIIKIRAEINEKKKERIVKINKTKIWFFKKINKLDKPLARLIKKRGESNQQN